MADKKNDKVYLAHKKILKICEWLIEAWKSYWRNDKEKYIEDIIKISKNQLAIMDYNYDYWLNIPFWSSAYNAGYVEINDYISLIHFNDAAKDHDNSSWYHISWSDDWRQPKNEWLMKIWFSTWWYMLHDKYASDTFEKMREELRSYGPKYCDSTNHNMYFSLDNCGKVRNDFDAIIKKYRELAIDEIKKKEIANMEERIKKLKEESKSK